MIERITSVADDKNVPGAIVQCRIRVEGETGSFKNTQDINGSAG